jgi:hypothetical protein
MEEQNNFEVEVPIEIDTDAVIEAQSAWASDSVRNFVSDVDEVLAKYPELVKMNWALFYQQGRLGFMDLDAFAKSVTAKVEIDGEDKSLEEIIDKNEE